MGITDQPMAPFPSKQAHDDWEKMLQRECILDGRASRRLGIPSSSCPKYRDADMAINWQNGWRWEDEGRP